MPKALQNVHLGDVIDIRDGTHDTPKYVEHGIPLITSKNLTDSGLCFREISFISEVDHNEISKRSAVEMGDILYGMIGTIGKPTLVETDRKFSIKNVALFKQSNPQIHNRYLRRLLNSPAINKQIAHASKGGTQKFVSLGALRGLKATFPSFPEQRRIAAILDQADALRAKRRESLAQLDSLTQSIFIEMFGNPIAIHSLWPKSLLDAACVKISDGTHHSPPIQSSGVPYITAKHLKEYGLDFYLAPWFVSPEDHRQIYSRCDPKFADVLYIKDGATTGIAAVNQYNFEFSMLSSLALLRPNTEVLNAYYLCYWLNNQVVKTEILGAMAGAAIRRLTLAKIKAIAIPLPPIELQRQFARRVTSIQLLKKAQNESLKELDTLFASLQHRAFHGEL